MKPELFPRIRCPICLQDEEVTIQGHAAVHYNLTGNYLDMHGGPARKLLVLTISVGHFFQIYEGFVTQDLPLKDAIQVIASWGDKLSTELARKHMDEFLVFLFQLKYNE